MTTTVIDAAGAAFSVEQQIRYDYSEPVTNLRQRLLVVPPPRHGRQERVDWSLRVDGAPATTVRTRRDGWGNVRIDLVVPKVQSWVQFDVRLTVAFADEHETVAVQPDRRLLRPTRLTALDDAIHALFAGDDEPERICARVHGTMTYEYGTTGVHTTAAEALAGGRGVCQDYAHLMVAGCRRAGIPARYVSGHLLGDGGSHAWVEVLRPHLGQHDTWVVEGWDPTHCRPTDDGYLTVATGRDYADVAPMSGTFDGDAVGTLNVRKQAVPR